MPAFQTAFLRELSNLLVCNRKNAVITFDRRRSSAPKGCRTSRIRCQSQPEADHKQAFRTLWGGLKCVLLYIHHAYAAPVGGGFPRRAPVARDILGRNQRLYRPSFPNSDFSLLPADSHCMNTSRLVLFFMQWADTAQDSSSPRPLRDRLRTTASRS